MLGEVKIKVARKPEDAYQHGNLREALVQAGLKLLAEGGLEKLSLRAAAQLAGVSHAAPYRHFRDKDALVAAIAETGFRLLTARMNEEMARADPKDLRQRLTAIGVGYVAFAIENPGYFRRDLQWSVLHRCRGARAETGRQRFVRDLAPVDRRRNRVRRLARGDPDELALASWALVHGLGMLAIDRALEPKVSGAAAVKQVTAGMARLLQEGLIRPA